MNESLSLYRAASTDGATQLDLTIAVYDALARDLNCIALAISNSDIEGRCRWSHHALLLLAYLESWVERLEEPELERSLVHFYSFLRSEILSLQVSGDSSSLFKLSMAVCETRATWQQKLQRASVTFESQPVLNSPLADTTDGFARPTWSA